MFGGSLTDPPADTRRSTGTEITDFALMATSIPLLPSSAR
jgi:hypothetical protein